MTSRVKNIEEEGVKQLFQRLRHGDPLLGVLDILGKLIRPGDQTVHFRLIDEDRSKLEVGDGAGVRMLAHYGSEPVQMRLMNDFQSELSAKAPYTNAGWLLLEVYGTPAVKARLRRDFPEKLQPVEGED
jgi:hypothetical protein